jgi:hypothetical protein
MLISQTVDLRKVKLGNAELTLTDGRREIGRILRVTDQFVSFQWGGACEDIAPSNIVKVHQLRTPGEHHTDVGDDVGEAIMLSVLVPIASLSWAAEKLKSPPVSPLRGRWQSSGSVDGRLDFRGSIVEGNLTTVRQGRYSVAPDGLHLTLDHAPEMLIPFHLECTHLVLDNPFGLLELQGSSKRVSAPIVGEWRGGFYTLNFKPDGRVEERMSEVRHGALERNGIGVKIHWHDSDGFGGQEWNGQIEHSHIVFHIGSVVAKFGYVDI